MNRRQRFVQQKFKIEREMLVVGYKTICCIVKMGNGLSAIKCDLYIVTVGIED